MHLILCPKKLPYPGLFSSFNIYYFSSFALSYHLCLVVPYLAFKYYCCPNFKLYEIIFLLVGLLLLNLSSATIPPLFPPPLSLLPTFVIFKNSSSDSTACLSASHCTSHLFSSRFCHSISVFLRLFLKVWCSTCNFQYLAYK